MTRYRISESAEHGVERVHAYRDLEIHHPSQHGHQPGRSYATVDGHREEVLKARTSDGHLMVSKDFVLTDEQGRRNIPVPSPAAGYVGKVDARNGLVCIFDHKGGELIAQIRHMDLAGSGLHEGQTVAYGQPLGTQGGYGHGKSDAYAVHTHIDFNTSRLDDFKRYFTDIDRGAIEIGRMPAHRAESSTLRPATAGTHHGGAPSHAAIGLAQRTLNHLGYTGADGRPLAVDGVLGPNSRHAIEQFQRDHHLPRSGGLDDATAARVTVEGRTMASDQHPAHGLYRQSLDAVIDLNRRHGVPDGTHTTRLAAAIAADALQHHMCRIDRVELSEDRRFARGVEVSATRDESALNRTTGAIDVTRAVQLPLATSSDVALNAHQSNAARHTHAEPAITRASLP
ncbi:XVIPCD domain-containing protein [Lysobacter claricitrinus]|uniref:XVIPCD domain-containing protein n=1 Tax=Lysobacter claricitrinus TaxID=3367728 RepID=UPI0037DB528E